MSLDEIAESLGFEVIASAAPTIAGVSQLGPPWKSSDGWCVVPVGVVADEPRVRPSDFQRYCTRLLALGEISDREHAFVLQVVPHAPDVDRTIREATARRWNGQLRIISFANLVTLAGLTKAGVLRHEDAAALLRPVDPVIDPFVHLVKRCLRAADEQVVSHPERDHGYWLARIEHPDHAMLIRMLRSVIGKRQLLPLGETREAPPRIRAGHRICFYVVGRGVVGHARVASAPEKPDIRLVRDEHPWICRLDTPVLYLDDPVRLLPAGRLDGEVGDNGLSTAFALTPLDRSEFQRVIRERGQPAEPSRPPRTRAI